MVGRGAVTRSALAGSVSVAELPNCVEPLPLALRWAWIPTAGPPTAVNGSFPSLSLAEQVRQPARREEELGCSWRSSEQRPPAPVAAHRHSENLAGQDVPGRTPYFPSSHLFLSRTLAFGLPVTHTGVWVAEGTAQDDWGNITFHPSSQATEPCHLAQSLL